MLHISNLLRKTFGKLKHMKTSQIKLSLNRSEEVIRLRAHELNTLLYADVDSISDENLKHFRKRLIYWCNQLNYTPEYTDAWTTHDYRLFLTLNWLQDIVTQKCGKCSVIETGGESVVTHLFSEYLPQVEWRLTHGDLRVEWGLEEQSADVILCTEVVEHLSDLPEGYQDSFEMTGFNSFLKICYQTLKPGGVLFLTTPNSTSVLHLQSILAGYAPWFFKKHIREYSIQELVYILKEMGFLIENIKSIHCLTAHSKMDYSPIFQMLLEHNYETLNRGDDIFVVVKK